MVTFQRIAEDARELCCRPKRTEQQALAKCQGSSCYLQQKGATRRSWQTWVTRGATGRRKSYDEDPFGAADWSRAPTAAPPAVPSCPPFSKATGKEGNNESTFAHPLDLLPRRTHVKRLGAPLCQSCQPTATNSDQAPAAPRLCPKRIILCSRHLRLHLCFLLFPCALPSSGWPVCRRHPRSLGEY